MKFWMKRNIVCVCVLLNEMEHTHTQLQWLHCLFMLHGISAAMGTPLGATSSKVHRTQQDGSALRFKCLPEGAEPRVCWP